MGGRQTASQNQLFSAGGPHPAALRVSSPCACGAEARFFWELPQGWEPPCQQEPGPEQPREALPWRRQRGSIPHPTPAAGRPQPGAHREGHHPGAAAGPPVPPSQPAQPDRGGDTPGAAHRGSGTEGGWALLLPAAPRPKGQPCAAARGELGRGLRSRPPHLPRGQGNGSPRAD